MIHLKSARNLQVRPSVVGTVHSLKGIREALRLHPSDLDFLEIRLDSFASDLRPLIRAIPKLPLPLIFTARHPSEGGAGTLLAKDRRSLFAQFIPVATFIDIELRSIQQLESTITDAHSAGVGLILSDHHFASLPPPQRIEKLFQSGQSSGATICKLAARTDHPSAVAKLLALFCKKTPLPLSVMGMGVFGKVSRLLLAQAGSVLNYGYLDQPNAPGQWPAILLKQRIAELHSTSA
ncbi:MAG: type I 3-dehydroquinate dehydratase [Verrucomicrobiota bacterium]